MTKLFFLFSIFSALVTTQAMAQVSDEQILKAVYDFHQKVGHKIDDWNCSYEQEDLEGTIVAKLKGPDDYQVYIVPVLCFAHRSNATTVFYQVTGEEVLYVAPISFPVSSDGKKFSATVPLANGEFSEESNEVIVSIISGYGSMRDYCGSDLRYGWNGYEFVLSEVKYQPCCKEKGAAKWCDPESDEEPANEMPIVFTHKVKLWK